MQMRNLKKRAAMGAAAVALGTVAFTGSALAHGHHGVDGDGGNGGNGGKANANCGVPVGVSLGLLGQGGDTKQCNAVGGSGGDGGDGVDY
jgi:hypothetical protein